MCSYAGCSFCTAARLQPKPTAKRLDSAGVIFCFINLLVRLLYKQSNAIPRKLPNLAVLVYAQHSSAVRHVCVRRGMISVHCCTAAALYGAAAAAAAAQQTSCQQASCVVHPGVAKAEWQCNARVMRCDRETPCLQDHLCICIKPLMLKNTYLEPWHVCSSVLVPEQGLVLGIASKCKFIGSSSVCCWL
jgi:hypothetical protein